MKAMTSFLMFLCLLVLFWTLFVIKPDAKAIEPFMPLLQETIKEHPNKWRTDCPYHKGGEKQQEIICKAWAISNGNKKFILTLKSENGAIDPTAQSKVVSNGKREPSYGLCQIHKGYHPEIVNDKRFFTDVDWQLEQCWKLFKVRPGAFYGYYKIDAVKKYFIF